jgi:hypothetical protein
VSVVIAKASTDTAVRSINFLELYMKKLITALLLVIGLMAMQSASAATVHLDDTTATNISGNDTDSVNFNFIGVTPIFTISGFDHPVDLLLSLTDTSTPFGFFQASADGSVVLGGFNFITGVNYTGSIQDPSQAPEIVPIPAAVWLFGSALMGLLGISRRKSATTLAA